LSVVALAAAEVVEQKRERQRESKTHAIGTRWYCVLRNKAEKASKRRRSFFIAISRGSYRLNIGPAAGAFYSRAP
jgi:hypothetical protein